MPTPIRQKRVAEQIRLVISDLLQRELRDPRLALASVTRVTIDRELAHADVYVSNLGEAADHTAMLAALHSAAGLIRREVGRRIRLRLTPEIEFHWDPGLENVEQVGRLLDRLKAEAPPAPAAPPAETDGEPEAPAADDDDDASAERR
ncbi:MAG: 30S ribosome-binding factor RbfA [Anaerolineales bacterium]|nr:30S ribosome-binding factor RbfA [Anaerolineales bacterium]